MSILYILGNLEGSSGDWLIKQRVGLTHTVLWRGRIKPVQIARLKNENIYLATHV